MTRLGEAPRLPSPELVARVEAALGRHVVEWRKPHTGLTPAERFVAIFAEGDAVFVKAAVDEETDRWLRNDHLLMTSVAPDLVPGVLAWLDDGPRPVLILEALTDAHWPADHFREERGKRRPVWWKPGQLELLLGALERVAATPPPSALPAIVDWLVPVRRL